MIYIRLTPTAAKKNSRFAALAKPAKKAYYLNHSCSSEINPISGYASAAPPL